MRCMYTPILRTGLGRRRGGGRGFWGRRGIGAGGGAGDPVERPCFPPRRSAAVWAIDQQAASGTGVDAVHVYAYPADGSGAPTGGGPGVLGAAGHRRGWGGGRPRGATVFPSTALCRGLGDRPAGGERDGGRCGACIRLSCGRVWGADGGVAGVPGGGVVRELAAGRGGGIWGAVPGLRLLDERCQPGGGVLQAGGGG